MVTGEDDAGGRRNLWPRWSDKEEPHPTTVEKHGVVQNWTLLWFHLSLTCQPASLSGLPVNVCFSPALWQCSSLRYHGFAIFSWCGLHVNLDLLDVKNISQKIPKSLRAKLISPTLK